MLPYIVLLAAAGAGGLLLCEWKPSRTANLWYLYAMTAVMCLMVLLRSSMVGVDYPTYQAYFETVSQNPFSFLFSPNNIYRFEPGFSLLTYLFSLVTKDAAIYMALIPVFIIIPRAITIYKQSCSIWFSVFVYISFGFFGYSMCTLRQELAISIMLFALPYLKDRKILPYMVIIVIAASFHKSLWLMVPVYFLAVIPLNWKSISFYAAGTLFVLIFSVPILGFVTQYVFKAYTRCYDEANGILKTVMYCAGTPDEEQLAQIKAYLAAKHHRETVELTICTQPELIGGFVLETGDLVEDYSVRGRIKNLEQKLTWR